MVPQRAEYTVDLNVESHEEFPMPELRRRKRHEASVSDTETDSEVNNRCDSDTLEEVSDSQTGVARKKDGHSKGETKMKKVAKRLFFGTMLLFGLVATISAGHLATLGLVVGDHARVPRTTAPALFPGAQLSARST